MILKAPSILLLDEPTNHLDIDTVEWLDNFLSNSKKTLIIVSHDRYFLDKVVTKTILIDNAEAEIFNGNYSYFVKENENRVMKQFNEYKNQQKQIEEMKKSIKRLREYGKLGLKMNFSENELKAIYNGSKNVVMIELLYNGFFEKEKT